MAVTVQVCDFMQSPVTAPPVADRVGIPQLSVAGPALVIAIADVGGIRMQPRLMGATGQLEKEGFCVSEFQTKVTWQVAALLQPSVAVTVHICNFTQSPMMLPPDADNVGVPQLSVAGPAAAMALAAIGSVGLQPKRIGRDGQLENEGFCVSEFQVNVTRQVAVLLQASVAVTVQVCDFTQSPVMAPPDADNVGVPQLSVAAPAAAMALAAVGNVGLQPRAMGDAGQAVKTGSVWSFTVIVCEQMAVSPQASVTIYVRVMIYWSAQISPEVTSPSKVTV